MLTLTRGNLQTLRLLTPHQGRLVPTVGGEVGLRLRVTIYTGPNALQPTDSGAAKRTAATPAEGIVLAGTVTAYAIDAADQSILALLEGGAEYGTGQIAKAVGLSPRATRTRLVKLVSRGLVREVGTGRTTPRDVTSPAAPCSAKVDRSARRARSWRRRRCR